MPRFWHLNVAGLAPIRIHPTDLCCVHTFVMGGAPVVQIKTQPVGMGLSIVPVMECIHHLVDLELLAGRCHIGLSSELHINVRAAVVFQLDQTALWC